MEIEIHELTAGYALDALEPDERQAYEDHLPDCAQCQEDLVSFWEVTGALALAATGPEPPPELRERIIAAAQAESGVTTQTVVPFRPRRLQPGRALGAIAAIAAVALVALGWWAVSLHGSLADTRSALADQRTVARVLADTNAEHVRLAAGSGTLVKSGERSVLVRHEVTAGDVVAVTLERAGGAKAPTTTPVVASHGV